MLALADGAAPAQGARTPGGAHAAAACPPVQTAQTAQAESGGAQEQKQTQPPKDPTQRVSAFMHFAMQKRPEVKLQNPGISFGDVAR